MHGIFRFLDQQMDVHAIKREGTLLSRYFADLVKQSSIPPQQIRASTQSISHSMMASMEEIGEAANPNNPKIAAGYTYFGQLLAHDLSAHRFLGNAAPSLRLRTLYGMGPGIAPYLYEFKPLKNVGLRFRGVKMTLEEYTTDFGVKVYDVPRHRQSADREVRERTDGIPLMADARNDQNFIISQMFVQLARAHNFLVDMYYDPGGQDSQGHLFKTASSKLIDIYQAIIVHDYLPKMLFDRTLIRDLSPNHRKNFVFYKGTENKGELSEIFSRAAFRVGHAQVRHIYRIFNNREPVPLYGKENLDLRGFIRDTRRAIDWNLFFGKKNKKFIQSAKSFNHHISLPLNELPFLRQNDNSLVNINLRQSSLNMADGLSFYKNFIEEVPASKLTEAEAACFEQYTVAEMALRIKSILKDKVDVNAIPLWMFLLLEAEIIGKGQTLGPLGSRIIAEQIMWTLLDDEESILRKQDKSLPEIFEGEMKDVTLLKLMQLGNVLQSAASETEDEDDGLAGLRTLTSRSTATPPSPNPGTAPLAVNEEQEYRGSEFHKVNSQAEFNVYLQNVGTLPNRTLILNNGFYDITTSRDLNYVELCSTGQYQEPGGKAKQQIRVYVSRRNLLYNLGFPGMENSNLDGQIFPEKIKGLLFIFGLDASKKLQFIVKRIDLDGKVPIDEDDIWYRTDKKHLVMPDETCLDENLTTVPATICKQSDLYGELVGQFIKDGFGALKMTATPQLVTIKRGVLLKLLGNPPEPANVIQVPEVDFYLSAAAGQEIMDFHNLILPEGEPQTTVPGAMFFNFALKSTHSFNGSTTVFLSEANRPYPYWCYKS